MKKATIIKDVAKNKEATCIEINLLKKSDKPRICEKYILDITPKRILGISRGVESDIRFELKIISYNHLVIKRENLSKVLQIRCLEMVGCDVTCKITTPTSLFDVQFDESMIEDCTLQQNLDDGMPLYTDPLCIEYEVNAYNKEEQIAHIEDRVELAITKIEQKPSVQILVNNKGIITYQDGVIVDTPFAHIAVKHLGKLNTAAPMSIEMDITVAKRDGATREDVTNKNVVFMVANKQTETKAITKTAAGVNIVGDPNASVLIANVGDDSGTIELDRIYSGKENVIFIPLYWSMINLSNPLNNETYEIKVSYSYSFKSSKEVMGNSFCAEMVTLAKNEQLVELGTILLANKEDGTQVESYIQSGKSHPVVFKRMGGMGIASDSITICNMANAVAADAPNASVIIKELKLEIAENEHTPRLGLEGGKTLADLVTINPTQGRDVARQLRYRQSITHEIVYDVKVVQAVAPTLLNDKRRYEPVRVTAMLSFLYAIDKEGVCHDKFYENECHVSQLADVEFERFELSIPIRIEPICNPEWLCVDFGTSSFVALYAAAAGVVPLPLQTTKSSVMRTAFGEDKADNAEGGDSLVSSLVMLNESKELLTTGEIFPINEYRSSAIWLSPPSSMINYIYQIPQLKSLMGYEQLPITTFGKAKSSFTYTLGDVSKTKLFDEVTQKYTPIGKVDTIFEHVYRQLFEYFLKPAINDQSNSQAKDPEIHRLVLTVPNTFSYKHINKLRDIAINLFPDLRPSYLKFVSESDAVACYYLANYRRFYEKSGMQIPKEIKERVLVYDMGAGTLDLTYFENDIQPSGIRTNILGKIGVNKAGNYIDYVLAEIIQDLISQPVDGESAANRAKRTVLVNTLSGYLNTDSNNADDAVACHAFKDYVRNQIKPVLNKPNRMIKNLVIGETSYPLPFTTTHIIEHEKFQAYLKDASEDVFNNLKALFGGGADTLGVDVVLFSGRSSCIDVIRKSVIESIYKLTGKKSCKFADMADERFIDPNNLTSTQNIDNLKTVVVNGAINYVMFIDKEGGAYTFRNKNVYATYGLIVESTRLTTMWYPLIDTRTIPTKEATKVDSISGIYTSAYNSNINNANGEQDRLTTIYPERDTISKIYMVQSFSGTTLNDWIDGKKEYITVLESLGQQDLPNDSYNVRVEITQENVVEFYLGNMMMAGTQIDDFENASFKKSMWPVKF